MLSDHEHDQVISTLALCISNICPDFTFPELHTTQLIYEQQWQLSNYGVLSVTMSSWTWTSLSCAPFSYALCISLRSTPSSLQSTCNIPMFLVYRSPGLISHSPSSQHCPNFVNIPEPRSDIKTYAGPVHTCEHGPSCCSPRIIEV